MLFATRQVSHCYTCSLIAPPHWFFVFACPTSPSPFQALDSKAQRAISRIVFLGTCGTSVFSFRLALVKPFVGIFFGGALPKERCPKSGLLRGSRRIFSAHGLNRLFTWRARRGPLQMLAFAPSFHRRSSTHVTFFGFRFAAYTRFQDFLIPDNCSFAFALGLGLAASATVFVALVQETSHLICGMSDT